MHNNDFNGKPHILVVDDEPLIRHSLRELLSHCGYAVTACSDGKEALDTLKQHHAHLILTDIKMPHMDGIELLKQIKIINKNTPVILMTSYASIENAVKAIKLGAYDYITKPIADEEIKILISRLLEQERLKEENIELKEALSTTNRENFHQIIGKSLKMQKIYSLIEAISKSRSTVLIQGESGTGKRLIAHALYKCNEQEKGKPFVEVSCGALTDTLLESELFGHAKGSFTGAIKDKEGRFEAANTGTIFLDEIDAFSLTLQVKLLRVLQDGEFERVGENKTRQIDVRIISATNQHLEDLIIQGKFRKDLYYRLNIISINLPPLRERKEDIPLLVRHFIKKHSKNISKKIDKITEDALMHLINYQWPGNIRELENIIERATVLSKNTEIKVEDLPEFLRIKSQENKGAFKLKTALESPEKEAIIQALEAVQGSRKEASKILGINRTTLYKKMQKYGFLKK